MRILFVCSKNRWRSRTAEKIFKNNGIHEIKSAGTESSARIKLTNQDLYWADLILVMEDKHLEKLYSNFDIQKGNEKVHVLGIPDIYKYMDTELIQILKISTIQYFE